MALLLAIEALSSAVITYGELTGKRLVIYLSGRNETPGKQNAAGQQENGL
jgi:hypothetical protein